MFTPKVSLNNIQDQTKFGQRRRRRRGRGGKGQYPVREEIKDLRALGKLSTELRSPKLARGISHQIASMGGNHPQRRVSEELGNLYARAARIINKKRAIAAIEATARAAGLVR